MLVTRLRTNGYECRTNVHPKSADPKPYRPPDRSKAGESSPGTKVRKAVDEPKAEESSPGTKAEETVDDMPEKTGSHPKADTWSDRVTVFDGSREFLNIDPQKPVLKGMHSYWRLNAWTTLETDVCLL